MKISRRQQTADVHVALFECTVFGKSWHLWSMATDRPSAKQLTCTQSSRPRLRDSPLSLLLHRWENWREERYGSLPRVSKSRALNFRAQAYNQLDYKRCYILRKVHLIILAGRQHAVCYCTQMFSEPNQYFLYKIIRFILYVNKTYHKAPR